MAAIIAGNRSAFANTVLKAYRFHGQPKNPRRIPAAAMLRFYVLAPLQALY
jgi:hypothetical protein